MIGAKHHRGFTLVELLVVAAVFSVLFLVGTTVFTRVQTFQRGVLTRQRVSADGRYALEAMARSVRLGAIDYAYYKSISADLTSAQDRLATRDQLGNQTCYQLNGSALLTGSSCSTSNPVLTPSDLNVQNFSVRISPRSDPYLAAPSSSADCRQPVTFDANAIVCACAGAGDPTNACWPDQRCLPTGTTPAFVCKNSVSQPVVTIILTTQSQNSSPGELAKMTLQTTIASRAYGR